MKIHNWQYLITTRTTCLGGFDIFVGKTEERKTEKNKKYFFNLIIIASIRMRACGTFVDNEFAIGIESLIDFTATRCFVGFDWTRWTGCMIFVFGSHIWTHWQLISIWCQQWIVRWRRWRIVIIVGIIVTIIITVSCIGRRWWISNNFR